MPNRSRIALNPDGPAWAPLGLTREEVRQTLQVFEARDRRANRERLLVALAWATLRSRPPILDRQGWPVDENDWPVAPPRGSSVDTRSDYARAISRAKGRRTRRARGVANATFSATGGAL